MTKESMKKLAAYVDDQHYPDNMYPSGREMAKESRNLWWIGFDSLNGRLLAGMGDQLPSTGLVPARSTILISQRPQIHHFRGWKLFVQRPHASDFLIHDIRAGNRATNAAAIGPIPADAFITNMDKLAEVQELFEKDGMFAMKVDKRGGELLGTEWCLPTVQPGTDITMTVENISSCTDIRFVAGLLGFGPVHGH